MIPGGMLIIQKLKTMSDDVCKISYGNTSLYKYSSKNVIESIGKLNMKNIEPKTAPAILLECF
ncbi:hypothetical protein NKOR_01780 [Candidatus Nitrosopumilus koreensis AR1]|uniref:Uncharacterized protein n=1 Tax=Candidatus Nitrosopumilus koreensis AR1 TaxID=1229908 RepID=K0B583_9ARCH|nr:hypothetical protein NKOR_01780 [Candidatus Nitrosopumilus koreensis AR1]